MRSNLRNFVLVTLISATVIPGVAPAQSQSVLCSSGGITVGFFNGVWNTRSQAQSGLAAPHTGPMPVRDKIALITF